MSAPLPAAVVPPSSSRPGSALQAAEKQALVRLQQLLCDLEPSSPAVAQRLCWDRQTEPTLLPAASVRPSSVPVQLQLLRYLVVSNPMVARRLCSDRQTASLLEAESAQVRPQRLPRDPVASSPEAARRPCWDQLDAFVRPAGESEPVRVLEQRSVQAPMAQQAAVPA